MTLAFPKMSLSEILAKALYGIGIIFEEIEHDIGPKLIEVTFCPTYNAIYDGYKRDDELIHSFSNTVVHCLR